MIKKKPKNKPPKNQGHLVVAVSSPAGGEDRGNHRSQQCFRQCWPSSKDFGRTTWCHQFPGGPGLGLMDKNIHQCLKDVYYDVVL